MRGVIHDLNNALTAIDGFADMGIRVVGENDAAKLRRYFGHIKSSTLTATRILRRARGEMEVEGACDVNAAIAAKIGALADLPGLCVSTSLSNSLPRAGIDPMDFERVLLNIVQNACDAMRGGGRIVIESRLGPGDEVIVIVRDTGKGMSAEMRSRLMRREEVSTKGEGHGAGMAHVVWPRLTGCGGRLEIVSVEGQGSEVIISLPAATTALH